MLIIFQTVSVPLLAFAFSLIGIALGLSYYSSLYYSLCGDGDAGRTRRMRRNAPPCRS